MSNTSEESVELEKNIFLIILIVSLILIFLIILANRIAKIYERRAQVRRKGLNTEIFITLQAKN